MQLLHFVFNQLVDLYRFVLIVGVILSWLVTFNVVNSYNQVVATILQIVTALTEPILVHIRRYVPPLNGLDLSFLVLFIGLGILQYAINIYVFQPLLMAGIP